MGGQNKINHFIVTFLILGFKFFSFLFSFLLFLAGNIMDQTLKDPKTKQKSKNKK